MLQNAMVAIPFSQQRNCYVLQGVHSEGIFCVTFIYFWLSLIVFSPVICLNIIFQTTVTGVVLILSPTLLVIINTSQLLLVTSLMPKMCTI